MAAETWFDAKDALELGWPRAWQSRCALPPASTSAGSAMRRLNWSRRWRMERDRQHRSETGDDADDPADVARTRPASVRVIRWNPTREAEPILAHSRWLRSASTAAVANAAPDPAAIRAEAIAHARAVVDLCRLAGQPQMAGASSNRTPVSTTSARRFWRQGRGRARNHRRTTRNPAAPRRPAPGARSSPAPSN